MKKLTKPKLKKIKKLFETKREDIIKSINDPDIEVDSDGDDIDLVQSAVINEVRERLSMRDRDTLFKLNEALRKIDEGTFGICEECEEVIGEKRLEAVLGCSLCIDCAQMEEKLSKQYA